MSSDLILVLQTLLGALLAVAVMVLVRSRTALAGVFALVMLVAVATPIAVWEPQGTGAGPRIRSYPREGVTRGIPESEILAG